MGIRNSFRFADRLIETAEDYPAVRWTINGLILALVLGGIIWRWVD